MSNTTQNKEELERKLIGKNVHSVYTLCNKCHSWGINIPLHEVCGNCNSDDTILYYDIETVNKSISQAHQSGIEEGDKKVEAVIRLYNQTFLSLAEDLDKKINTKNGICNPLISNLFKEAIKEIYYKQESLKENKQ